MNIYSNIASHLLCIPSISVAPGLVDKVQGISCYEERMLIVLLQLDDPYRYITYVTSNSVSMSAVNYYFGFLRNVSVENARSRLTLLTCRDSSPGPLSGKILKHPRILNTIQNSLDLERTEVMYFAYTELEEQISQYLGISVENSYEACKFWGSKCGSRQAFKLLDFPHVPGNYQVLYNLEDLAVAILELVERNPSIIHVMIKIDDSASGLGNGVLEIPRNREIDSIITSFQDIRAFSGDSAQEYIMNITKYGAIIEEYIPHEMLSFPSIQGEITAEGKCIILSSHEQMIDDQIYKGCSFPCKEEYRSDIQNYCLELGEFLASKGIRSHFGIDFMSWIDPLTKAKQFVAVEINIRRLGTTHPMMTLDLLIKGQRIESGDYVDPNGDMRFYIASDAIQLDCLKGISASGFLSIIETEQRLKFDLNENTGVVFHMFGAIQECGKVGVVCINISKEEAQRTFQRIPSLLTETILCNNLEKKNLFIEYDSESSTSGSFKECRYSSPLTVITQTCCNDRRSI